MGEHQNIGGRKGWGGEGSRMRCGARASRGCRDAASLLLPCQVSFLSTVGFHRSASLQRGIARARHVTSGAVRLIFLGEISNPAGFWDRVTPE